MCLLVGSDVLSHGPSSHLSHQTQVVLYIHHPSALVLLQIPREHPRDPILHIRHIRQQQWLPELLQLPSAPPHLLQPTRSSALWVLSLLLNAGMTAVSGDTVVAGLALTVIAVRPWTARLTSRVRQPSSSTSLIPPSSGCGRPSPSGWPSACRMRSPARCRSRCSHFRFCTMRVDVLPCTTEE